mmetsp:Transcript_17705/g.35322  ORF Transcript_17705/g.35322 Transcript_17705/m.35322 type:complete len:280 (-) Transcript_17705:31-870(-)
MPRPPQHPGEGGEEVRRGLARAGDGGPAHVPSREERGQRARLDFRGGREAEVREGAQERPGEGELEEGVGGGAGPHRVAGAVEEVVRAARLGRVLVFRRLRRVRPVVVVPGGSSPLRGGEPPPATGGRLDLAHVVVLPDRGGSVRTVVVGVAVGVVVRHGPGPVLRRGSSAVVPPPLLPEQIRALRPHDIRDVQTSHLVRGAVGDRLRGPLGRRRFRRADFRNDRCAVVETKGIVETRVVVVVRLGGRFVVEGDGPIVRFRVGKNRQEVARKSHVCHFR